MGSLGRAAISIQKGFIAEKQACDFLLQQGLVLLEKNFSCAWGELDLIMKEQATLVFVEVRSRSSNKYGTATASIHHFKQQRLLKTAWHYLQVKKLLDQQARFDILAIDGIDCKINWVKNAFELGF